MVWGEKIVVHNQAKVLRRECPGAEVLALSRDDLATIENVRVDLLLSYYTGPGPPWRVDDIADFVDGVTLLVVLNHGELLGEFTRVPVDGYITNSARAADFLCQYRPRRTFRSPSTTTTDRSRRPSATAPTSSSSAAAAVATSALRRRATEARGPYSRKAASRHGRSR